MSAAKRRALWALAFAGLVALLWLASRSSVDSAAQDGYSRDLRRLQALDARLNDHVMRSRSGAVVSYDPIVQTFAELRRLNRRLEQAPPFMTKEGRDEMAARRSDLEEALVVKEERVDAFKTNNAVLRNSLRFFPVAAKDLALRLASEPSAADLAARVDDLLRDVLLLNLVPDREMIPRTRASLARVEAGPVSPAHGADVKVLVLHARVILARKPVDDDLVGEILRLPVSARADEFEAAYSRRYHAALQALGRRRLLLSLLAIAIVGAASAAVILRLKRAGKELADANAALRREREREKELSELKSRFVSMTSHEFRTPLSIILSSSEMLDAYAALNCAALSESLLESELFGHEKGAFTGALKAQRGLFESAQGGTVFLDEVGDLPMSLQVKLLRVLEARQVIRVGGREPIGIDVRFVSATNRDLEAEASHGRFRQDLYFRLNGISLTVPALRDRVSEIVPLAQLFVRGASELLGRADVPVLSPEAVLLLEAHAWPGNVRELRNVIERAVVLPRAQAHRRRPLPLRRQPDAGGRAARHLPPHARHPPLRLQPAAPPQAPRRVASIAQRRARFCAGACATSRAAGSALADYGPPRVGAVFAKVPGNRASCASEDIMNNQFTRLSALILFPVALFGCAGSATDEAIGSEQELLSASMCPDSVPASLTPAPDQRLFSMLHAEGAQIYECKAVGNAFAWTFIAPQADLLNPGGDVVGTHYAGPTWQSDDGSSVVGAKLAGAPAPIPGAVPWLLLGAVSHAGDGKMSGVTSIQRLNTTGGVAPASGCDAAHQGTIVNVPYTADYFFYRTSHGGGDNPQCAPLG